MMTNRHRLHHKKLRKKKEKDDGLMSEEMVRRSDPRKSQRESRETSNSKTYKIIIIIYKKKKQKTKNKKQKKNKKKKKQPNSKETSQLDLRNFLLLGGYGGQGVVLAGPPIQVPDHVKGGSTERLYLAYYSTAQLQVQVKALIEDSMRTTVAHYDLDELFEVREREKLDGPATKNNEC